MADLLDIAPSTAVEVVRIDGERIIVHGLHADAIASIVSRFPHLASIGGGDLTKLIAHLGNAIGPIIAAGCGHLNEKEYEDHAARLLIEDQLKLATAIIGLTFPNGLLAFVTAFTAFLASPEESEKVYTVRLKSSPSPSPSLSVEDSPPTLQ